ncbi:Transmembrane emp24 domain-containing protein 9 [Perkinsus olseni]|uniref:Transmembrane emp24 domain-containing protein 9 n=1 Tax=Perkinsus olseni TaxID=32597 RepID=A0A7J6TVD6_PEROL|nr:Transmembrane emp24 domain-containing protein 9 [Perkinsus olseni]KAF4756416.1 Transmembrane emp24 domain-containing protein 9 [Perkinsus olseni]
MPSRCEIRLEPRHINQGEARGAPTQPIIRTLPRTQQSGREAFSPKLGGEYDICTMCLEEVGRRWKAQLSSKAKTKWSLTVDALDEAELGDLPFGPEDVATGGDFKTTASKMKSLIGRVTGMVSENEYERDQEEIFRDASETVNGRVMWAAILQIIIYAAIAAYQVRSLRSFFRQHKIL